MRTNPEQPSCLRRHKAPGRGVAKGSDRGNFTREVGFKIDDETLTEIRDLAIRAGTSLSEQVRSLIEIGLETLKLEKKNVR
jgi:hypothetical protein